MLKRSLPHVVDDIGMGMAQVRLILLAGGVYISGGTLLFTASCLTPALAEEFQCGKMARGALFSFFFLGKCMGNLSAGSLDRLIGRRMLILGMYAGCCVVPLLMAIANYYALVLVCWCVLGYLLGVGTPPWNSMAGEMVPSKWIYAANSASMVLYGIATIGTALLVHSYDPSLKNLGDHWRKVLVYSTMPSLLLLILGLVVGFPESPYWLCSQGRVEEAQKVLRAMAVENRREDVSLEFEYSVVTVEESSSGGFKCAIPKDIRQLFSDDLCKITMTTCFSILIINFLFNGIVYALPIVLPSLNLSWSPLIVLSIASACDSLGYFLANPLSGVSRKVIVLTYLTGVASCTIVFLYGWDSISESHPADTNLSFVSILLGIYGLRIWIAIGYIVLYTFCAEAYPTNARTAGSGFCMAAGRIGGIGCSLVFEFMHSTFNTHAPYFMLMVVLCVLNAGLIKALLPDKLPMREALKRSTADEKI